MYITTGVIGCPNRAVLRPIPHCSAKCGLVWLPCSHDFAASLHSSPLCRLERLRFSISTSLSIQDTSMLGGKGLGERGRWHCAGDKRARGSRLGLPPPFRAPPSSIALVRPFLPLDLGWPPESTSTSGFVVVLRCSDDIPHLRLSPLPFCAVILLIHLRILFDLCHDIRVLVLTFLDLWVGSADLLVSSCSPLVPRSDLCYGYLFFMYICGFFYILRMMISIYKLSIVPRSMMFIFVTLYAGGAPLLWQLRLV
jgi:hypothetical protein